MNEHARWGMDRRLEAAAAALEKNGFGVAVLLDREAVVRKVLDDARDADTVGFGGSLTLVELGLPDRLRKAGKTCLVHGAPGLAPEERVAVMRRQLTCDLFLSGTNAVTLDGKLVNIDATGNRVGALAFGPKRVRVVVGGNKIVDDVADGVRRIKRDVAPANAHRLGFATPCATTGRCADCRSPDRICRIVHVMERRPRLTDLAVYLVAEPLGL